MNRIEFMKELEYLLQDIPEEEKEDAISYYRDYLEEAGEDHEEQAIREFGSPERVASIIRSELMGNLEEGGAFTESGYQDERFKEPNYQVVKHQDLPEVQENGWQDGKNSRNPEENWSRGGQNGGSQDWHTSQNQRDDSNWNARKQDYVDRTWFKRLLKVGLLLIILSVAAPLALGIGGTLLGAAAGVILLLLGGVLLIGVLTVTAVLGAIALLVAGFGLLFTNPWGGLLTLGAGTLVLGLGLIGIALSVLIYGRFLPWCVREIVAFISRLFRNGRRKQA